MSELRATGRTPPYSHEAEQAVLGAVLLDNDALGRITGVLSDDDFHRPAHRRIIRAMLELFEAGTPIDEVTLANALRTEDVLDEVGGVPYIAELAASIPASVTLQYYIEIVKNKSILRSLIGTCTELVEDAYDSPHDIEPLMDKAESRVFELGEFRDARDVAPLRMVLENTYKQIEERYARKGEVVGVPTGLADLDRLTAGLQPEELIILAARPSMGKTALALNILLNTAVQFETPAAFFSLEMSKESLGARLFSMHGQVKADHLRKGTLTDDDWGRLVQAQQELYGVPLHIDDTPSISMAELRSKARRLKAEHGVELLVIDYLQLMGTDSTIQSREQQISALARGLKGLAKELHISLLVLSQLNRSSEARKDKRPMLSDLRESGAIEQDADLVMFIHRDDYYTKEASERPNVAELEIAKQRNGPTGRVELYFEKEMGRFLNLAKDQY
jgi:replicative DNA helicase